MLQNRLLEMRTDSPWQRLDGLQLLTCKKGDDGRQKINPLVLFIFSA